MSVDQLHYATVKADSSIRVEGEFVVPLPIDLPYIEGVHHADDVLEVFIDCGLDANEKIARVKDSLARAGITHIKVSQTEVSPFQTFLMDTEKRIYFVRAPLAKTEKSKLGAKMTELLNKYIMPLREWRENAVGDVGLDWRGIVFEEEQDAALYRLTFNVPYRSLAPLDR